jgi:hypothetical protein
MKRCTKCGALKSPTEFYAAKGGRDGLRGDCKSCFAARARGWYGKNRAKAIENAKRWRENNLARAQATRRARYAVTRERAQEQHLTRTFGMSLADYDAMLESQGGVCAICRHAPDSDERFHVDHHDPRGGVRGILCVRCNNALGQFREDVEIAARAVDYLASDGFVRTGAYELEAAAVLRARRLVATPG